MYSCLYNIYETSTDKPEVHSFFSNCWFCFLFCYLLCLFICLFFCCFAFGFTFISFISKLVEFFFSLIFLKNKELHPERLPRITANKAQPIIPILQNILLLAQIVLSCCVSHMDWEFFKVQRKRVISVLSGHWRATHLRVNNHKQIAKRNLQSAFLGWCLNYVDVSSGTVRNKMKT